jgi:hypothetical protein
MMNLFHAIEANDLPQIHFILRQNNCHNAACVPSQPAAEPILAAAVRRRNIIFIQFLLSLEDVDVNVSVGGQHCLDLLWDSEESQLIDIIRPFVNHKQLHYPKLFALLLRHNLFDLMQLAVQTQAVSFTAVPFPAINDWVEYYILMPQNAKNTISLETIRKILTTFRINVYEPKRDLGLSYVQAVYLSFPFYKTSDCIRCQPKNYSDDRSAAIRFFNEFPILRTLAMSQHRRASCKIAILSRDLLINIVRIFRLQLRKEMRYMILMQW